MRAWLVSWLLAAACVCHAASDVAVARFDLDTGRDFADGTPVNVRIGLAEPKNPKAVAILFTGSRGLAQIQPDGSTPNPNFLLRSRMLFARHKIAAIVMGAPDDRLFAAPDGATIGLGFGFRRSATHAGDVQTVIDFARARFPGAAVWLVGTSRGTTSVAYATLHLQRRGASFGPDGIALTASIVIPVPPQATPVDNAGDSLLALQGGAPTFSLDEIQVPVLLVHHVADACFLTPYAGVAPLAHALSSAPLLETMAFEGGGPATGDPCDSLHYHGFPGIEEEVVKRMSQWMREASSRAH